MGWWLFLPPVPVRVSRVACCVEDVLPPQQLLHDHDAQDRRRFGLDFFSAIFSGRNPTSLLVFSFVCWSRKTVFSCRSFSEFSLSFVLQFVISLGPSNLVCQGSSTDLAILFYFLKKINFFFFGVGEGRNLSIMS